MKKFIILLLLFCMCICIVACENNKKTTSDVSTENVSLSHEALEEIVARIYMSEKACTNLAANLLNDWRTDSFFAYHFDEEAFNNRIVDIGNISAIESSHKIRKGINNVMEEARQSLGKSGDGEFYNAVKEYYISVSSYASLVSNFPTGYNKITYSQAVADCQNECKNKFNNVTFYTKD